MDRKKMLIVSLSIVALAVAMMAVYPAVSASQSSNWKGNQNVLPPWGNGNAETVPNGWPRWMVHGRGCFGLLEVSEAFKNKALDIAKSDKDVQSLLNDGYSVTGVRPVVKAVVGEDGSVTMKATGAILTLSKDSARAIVKVDLENAKVTGITILTKTTITKP